jgi:hypothetical protein
MDFATCVPNVTTPIRSIRSIHPPMVDFDIALGPVHAISCRIRSPLATDETGR